jgi:hypothetical protein
MALLYDATLRPSKLELLSGWLPTRTWMAGEPEVRKVGTYRFDDPAGEVGMEAFLLQSGDGPVLHVPLTYRGAPVAELDELLVGTMEHSVLGKRWVYDACGDPVWAAALATTVLTGGTEAEQVMEEDGLLVAQKPTATVRGSGSAEMKVPDVDTVSCRDEGPTTVVQAGALGIVVVRVVGADVSSPYLLTGSWIGGGPAVLAGVSTS